MKRFSRDRFFPVEVGIVPAAAIIDFFSTFLPIIIIIRY